MNATTLIGKTIAQLKHKPQVWINASATGYYGNTGDAWVTEESVLGKGFLADVCDKWEKAATVTDPSEVRLVKLRIGIVLSSSGGALQKMLIPFKLGLGGVIGSGDQYMSWIDLLDLCAIVHEAVVNDEYSGPINLVTDEPVTNREFTKALGAVLHRPTFLGMPEFVAKFIFGEVADELFLTSCRVKPKKLMELGYRFQRPKLKETLEAYYRAAD